MKKLNKVNVGRQDTIEAYNHCSCNACPSCGCICVGSYAHLTASRVPSGAPATGTSFDNYRK